MRSRLAVVALGPPRQVPLSIAHAISAAADSCVTISLAGSLFFSLSPDASRQQVLLYLLVTMAPLAVLAPLVGPTVDRFRRRPQAVAAVCYLLRGLACLALAASLYRLSFYLFAVALLMISKASGVVKQALVPLVTDDSSKLVSSYARLARLSTVGGGIGAAVGAGVYRWLGAPWVLWLAALLFLGAAITIVRLHPVEIERPVPEDVEYAEMHLPTVIVGSIGFMAIRGAVGFFVFTMAFTLRRASEPTWVYAAALGVYGTGSFIGNVITPLLRRKYQEQTLLSLAISAPALLALVGVLGVSRPLLLAVACLVGLSTTLGRHAFDALLQSRAPAASRGRAGARYETRFSLAYVLGAVAATPIRLPAEASMAVLSVIYIPALVVFIRAFGRARRVERMSAGASLQTAFVRLTNAEELHRAGDVRAAVIESFAAVDLAQLADETIGGTRQRTELDALRVLALGRDPTVSDADAERAISLARVLLSRRSVKVVTTPT
ncbi:MAG: Major Facilitator Superfamily transporter [Ilumatobacteraceae bacterium]|nr:Major Facilitator Superfamily transporter [Ilumatobacteraceae bacterium]